MADWRDFFSSGSDPGGLVSPGAPAGGGGPGRFADPGLAQGFGTGGSTPPPHPGSPASRFFDWDFSLPRFVAAERVEAVYAALTRAKLYLWDEVKRATGEELSAILGGILPGLLMFIGVLAVTTLLGAAAGAALGALAFGIGAAPGAAIGAELGFDAGVAILNWLGLAFLVVYIGKSLIAGTLEAGSATRLAWSAPDVPAGEQATIDRAAHGFAYAVGLVVRGILQAVVAYLLAKGTAAAAERLPGLVGKLRTSKLGAGFADWVERNWVRLVNNPKLKEPLAEGGGGGGKPTSEGPASQSAPSDTPPPKQPNTPQEAPAQPFEASDAQLQRKFKHAGDFGVDGNYSKANAAKFGDAISEHVNSPDTQAIQGSYRGDPATIYVNPKSGLGVVADPQGNFVSGWKLSPQQMNNVLTTGKLGGG